MSVSDNNSGCYKGSCRGEKKRLQKLVETTWKVREFELYSQSSEEDFSAGP